MSREHHNLKDAIARIPGLIATEYAKKEPKTAAKAARHPVYTSPRHSRRWLLTGVIMCSLLILVFWLLYISELISTHKSNINPIGTFNNSEDSNLSNLISTFSTLEDKLKENLTTPSELKALVADAITPLLSTSSTPSTTTTSSTAASSTLPSTTSTTITTTTTP